MGSSFFQTFLQIFLLANVFAIGFLVAVGIRHAREHFKPADQVKKPKAGEVRISPVLRERLLHEAEAHFQIVVNANAKKLAHDLDETAVKAASNLGKLNTNALEKQAESYARTLQEINATNERILASAHELAANAGGQSSAQTEEFTKKLEAELTAAAEQRIAERTAQIDTKLSEAVVSFLVETLGHEIDLGSQMKYILARLDENKDALKAEIR